MDPKVMVKVEKDAEGKYFLTDGQIEIIVDILLKVIKLPEYLESIIKIILIKVIKRIDSLLYQLLPNEIYDFINSTKVGFSPEEAKEIKVRIVKLINDRIDIPFLSEDIERLIIETVIDILFTAMIKGNMLK